jgi:hypothetical protein
MVALGHLRQAMADIGQAFVPGEWQDGRAYGDALLQVPESVLREYLMQRGLPKQHDLQRFPRRVFQTGEVW